MAQLILVRHAQASFGSEHYDQLSPLGRQQATWLGEYFSARGLRFHRVVAGSLQRQQETAQLMLSAMGQTQAPVQTLVGLNEYPADALYTSYTRGRDALAHQRADARDYWRTFRQAMLAWAGDALDAVPERWNDFGQRVRQAVDLACGDVGRDDVVLVVSSGGAIGRLIADTVGAPAATAIEFNLQFRNTGLCELISASAGLRLISYNAIPHLERSDRRHAITFA